MNIDDTGLSDDGAVLYNDVPYTGEAVDLDGDGDISAIKMYRYGREDGIQRTFFGDGQLSGEYTASDGSAVGEARRWHINGQLAQYQVFNESGRLISREMWDENGAPVED